MNKLSLTLAALTVGAAMIIQLTYLLNAIIK